MDNTNKTFFCAALTVLVVSTGCRYNKDRSATSDFPDDRIVAELSELSVDDLLCIDTNVSTAVASTNLEVAVARELKRRYGWISVYEEPWEFDGCRHIFIHICDEDHYFGSYDIIDNTHISDYPLAEIHAKTYEMSGPGRFFVYVNFRQGKKWIVDWEKSTAQQPIFFINENKLFSADRAVLAGSPYKTAPEKPELLDELGALALYAGETTEDSAYNKARGSEPLDPCRNSLFLRQRKADGTDEWRVLLTTGSNWRETDGMDEWRSDRARDVKNCFYVYKASFSSDGRHLWLVCSPHTYTYSVVCSYDVCSQTFRVLIDGDTADEQPDGMILAKNKKTYLFDDNGEPLGARFYDAWINPDGEIVRKGKLMTVEELEGAEFVPKE